MRQRRNGGARLKGISWTIPARNFAVKNLAPFNGPLSVAFKIQANAGQNVNTAVSSKTIRRA